MKQTAKRPTRNLTKLALDIGIFLAFLVAIPPLLLLALNRLEEGAEIALAKAPAALALDDLSGRFAQRDRASFAVLRF